MRNRNSFISSSPHLSFLTIFCLRCSLYPICRERVIISIRIPQKIGRSSSTASYVKYIFLFSRGFCIRLWKTFVKNLNFHRAYKVVCMDDVSVSDRNYWKIFQMGSIWICIANCWNLSLSPSVNQSRKMGE